MAKHLPSAMYSNEIVDNLTELLMRSGLVNKYALHEDIQVIGD